MPSPIAFAFLGWMVWHHATRSTVEIASAGVLVFVLLLAWIILRRRRDPIGRSLAAYNLALTALRDSAARATTARPASTDLPAVVHDPPQPVGVTIVTSSAQDR
jgi:hypothetical protein